MSVTVTAKLNTVLADVLQGNAFVRFRLRGFSGMVPRVNGTAIIAETTRDVFPDASGNISTTLWANDSISPANTFYSVDWFDQGRIVATGNYIITGTTFDLNAHDPVSPPSPIFPFQLVLEHGGVMNQSQNLLNLIAGANVTINEANGAVTIASSGGGGGAGIGKVVASFSGTPTFAPNAQICVVQITLAGNVTSSTFNSAGITAPAFVLMQIIQDGSGGHSFVFPANFLNAGGIGTTASQTTFQLFYWDGTNCYAIGVATVYP